MALAPCEASGRRLYSHRCGTATATSCRVIRYDCNLVRYMSHQIYNPCARSVLGQRHSKGEVPAHFLISCRSLTVGVDAR